jgi:hypothetical protein
MLFSPAAANPPVTDGLVGHYFAPGYDPATKVWSDATPGFSQQPVTAHAGSPTLNMETRRGTEIEYVAGVAGSGFRFPQTFNDTSQYTLLYVARWVPWLRISGAA